MDCLRPWLRLALCCSGLLLSVVAWSQQVEVRVKGDHSRLQQNAEAYIGKVEDRNVDDLRRYVPHAREQVQKALRALGYYNPVIKDSVTDQGKPHLLLTVDPGQPVIIRSRRIDIQGPAARDPDFLPVNTDNLAVGAVLNHAHYETVRKIIENRAARLGYFDGHFKKHRLAVDPDAHAADIELVYESGERYRLGEVTFDKDSGFEEQLLRRFVTFQEGSEYNADKLATLNSDLSNSGYFSRVLVDASPSDAQGRVIPVHVRLTRRDPRSVAAGIGFSTDVGPRLRGTWTEHWINPMGHRRGAETDLAVPRQSVSGWYEIPLDPPMTDSIRMTAGYQRENIRDVKSDRLTVGEQWQHGLDTGWKRILSLRLEQERYQLGGRSSDSSRLLLPGVGYSKLEADSPLDPSRGFRLQFDVTGAHRQLLSDVDVLQIKALARGLITVGNGHRLLGRVQVGAIATNQFSSVPPSLRFFTGGDQSVRGYGYQALSPQDSNGVSIGGRYLVVGSVEYQFPLSQKWRLATFVDKGNAIDALTDPLATGVGVGFRWITPVGPLRFDIARGLNDNLGGGWRLHFSMGPEL